MHLVHANGAAIPAIGLGTWRLWGEECARVVEAGLRAGYRHVDTAQMYDNEREVGAGIAAAGVPRDDLFITTKIWPSAAAPGHLERAAEERLELLGLGYVDLLLIHWPPDAVPIAEVVKGLARVKRDGLARHIGISNCTVALIEDAVAACPEPLVTNQVEYHPFLSQAPVLGTARRHGLSLTAYCPLARGRVAEAAPMREIAAKHGRTTAQIALRWLVQQDGVIAIPKTATIARLVENLQIFDFELTPEEMRTIHGLAEPEGRMVETQFSPDWD